MQQFKQGLPAGWQLMASDTPIQPVLIGASSAALAVAQALAQAGFWVPAIRPPTVPTGSARLRLTFSAAHTVDDVGALLTALGNLSKVDG
ncbi:MAG: hypothetical protein B7X64_10380 [Halothiobacillus sp. 39-53-45]|nr:MAG: hypothetical protein B7X64_10380 [Halothiobacillus sp. 39-53-45]